MLLTEPIHHVKHICKNRVVFFSVHTEPYLAFINRASTTFQKVNTLRNTIKT